MDHFTQVGVLEVFLEAAPTTFLLVVMIVTGLNSHGEDGLQQLLMGNGWGKDLALFMISCASSIFSFAFGVSRYEYGVLSLTMLLGGRFLTAFLACLCTGATKGVILGGIVASSERYYLLITTATAATMTMIVFLPPFLLALFSTIGFNKNSFKILLSHPELVIMPICKFLKKMHYIFNLIIL